MEAAASNVVILRANEFLTALRNGKLEWTSEELASYFLESKKKAERVTVQEHNLGPIDVARTALVAKVTAGLLGITAESARFERDGKKLDGYVFSVPSGHDTAFPTVVEKIVERVVEKMVEVEVEKIVRVEVPVERIVYRDAPAKQDNEPGEVAMKYPGLPLARKALPTYQTPVWYKRMAAALDAGKHVALAGPPGIGKSTGPEQYFIRKGQPFAIVNGDAGFRRRDIEGSVEIQAGTTFFKVAEFATAAINGWGCILNEVNAADPDALLWINGILEERVINIHGKAYPVHPDFKLVVTYNPGLIGTKALPQAFKDRFFPVKLGFPELVFLRKLVVAKTDLPVHTTWLPRLLTFAMDCWAAHERGNLRYQISPRRLFDVVFLMTENIAPDLDTAIRQAVLDAVDSAADVQLMTKLIVSPGSIATPVSRFGTR